jgi:hypothetical protein
MAAYARYFAAGSQGVSDALTLISNMPPSFFAAFLAANATAQDQWLTAGSWDIDKAKKYQGRRIDPVNQVNEFPRLAYVAPNRIFPLSTAIAVPWVSPLQGDIVWDWDNVNLVTVVPQDVLLAVVYQANYLAGGESKRVDDQFKGVKEQHANGAGESYSNPVGAGKSDALRTGLCRKSHKLMERFFVADGRIV